jgi:hypothetical protein
VANKSARSGPIATIDVVPVAVVAALVGLVLATLRRGGFGSASFASMLAFVAIAVVSSALSRPTAASLRRVSMVVAPLLGSTLVSTVVVGDLHKSIPTLALLAGLVGVGAVGLAVAPSERELSQDLVVGVVGVVVAITAWFGLAAHWEPWGREADLLWRGSSSLTYSNAAAGVVGPLCVFTLWRVLRLTAAAPANERTRVRLLGFQGYVLAVGLGATLSRGGAGAFAIGLVVLAFLERRRWRELLAALCVVVLPAFAAVVIPVMSASVSADPQVAGSVLALVFGGAVNLALVRWLAAAGSLEERRSRCLRLASVGLAAVGLAAVAVVVVAPASLDDVMSSRVRLWSPQSSGDGDAFLGDRGREWSAAVDQIGERPVVGHGPGGVNLAWNSDGRAVRARFVHNEYLELAVTHGLAGVAAFVVSTAMAVRCMWRRAGGGAEGSLAGVVATMVVFLTHSAIDFLWHIPVLPLLFALVVTLAVPRRE